MAVMSFGQARWLVGGWLMICGLGGLCNGPELFAQQTTLNTQAQTEIEAVVAREKQRLQIPGLSICIAIKNQIRYAKAFGLSDVENSVPVTTQTVFRTASIAKPMTAIAVMQLVEQQKVELDSPIQTYLPQFPKKRWPLTTRNLLGHLGGVRHYKVRGESAGTTHYLSNQSAFEIFAADPLVHEPGSKFLYTTYGYCLLGGVIEGASSEPYTRFMKENVFEKAGMKRTQIDHHFSIIPDRSRGYLLATQKASSLPKDEWVDIKPGELTRAALHDTSMKVPGGGILSTPTDLVRFAIAVNQDELVSAESKELMWTRQTTTTGKLSNYGLGWNVKKLSDGKKRISHSGGQAGVTTLLLIYPDQGLVLAGMCNLERASLENLLTQIANVL